MGKVSRIVLTRPVVEAGKRLGFLPGRPLREDQPVPQAALRRLSLYARAGTVPVPAEEETIEIIPLAYMRGRTIDNAVVVLDEGQNTTAEQMKMFLTRIGQDSQIIVTGDVTQIDLEERKQSGLVVVEKILAGVEGIKIVHFTTEDVVRHALVKKIIKAYEEWKK